MFKIFRVKIFVDFIAHENFLPTKYFQTTVVTIIVLPINIILALLQAFEKFNMQPTQSISMKITHDHYAIQKEH